MLNKILDIRNLIGDGALVRSPVPPQQDKKYLPRRMRMLSSDSSVVCLLPSEDAALTFRRKAVISKICVLMILIGLWATSIFAQAPCAFTTTGANVTETCGNVGIGTASPGAPLHLLQNNPDGTGLL